MSQSMRQLIPRESLTKVKKLIDTCNIEEIHLIKQYVEDRLNVDITFTPREEEE